MSKALPNIGTPTPLERCLAPDYEATVRDAARRRETEVGVARFRAAIAQIQKEGMSLPFVFMLDGKQVLVTIQGEMRFT